MNYPTEVDALAIEIKIVGQQLCSQCLAGPARTNKMRTDAKPTRAFLHKTPVLIDVGALLHESCALSSTTAKPPTSMSSAFANHAWEWWKIGI